MGHVWIHFSALLIAVSAGCAHPERTPLAPSGGGATEPPSRRPPAVAVDPSPQLPAPAKEASTQSRLVSLREPSDSRAALDVVTRFFDAALDGSLEELETLLHRDARLRAPRRGRRESIQSAWQHRFHALDYTVLRGQLVYRETDVEIYRAADVDALHPARLIALRPGEDEVVVRVPIASPSHGSTRFFGDEVVFLLRPTDQGYKIGEVYEDFHLP